MDTVLQKRDGRIEYKVNSAQLEGEVDAILLIKQ
jgi:hypothetical protein